MWILIAVLTFAVLITFLFFIIRILWRRVQHQKIRKDAPQKPLTLHRRPTPAVKSPATGNAGSNTHYLKKSPSPTGLSPSVSNTYTFFLICHWNDLKWFHVPTFYQHEQVLVFFNHLTIPWVPFKVGEVRKFHLYFNF